MSASFRTASSETTFDEHPESITNRQILPLIVQVELKRDVRCISSFVLGARQFLRIMRRVPVSPLTSSSSTSSPSVSYMGSSPSSLSLANKPCRP